MTLSPEVAIAVAVWVEALLYGIYACLFFEACYIIMRKDSSGTSSAKVFLGGIVIMFLLATAHIVVNLYRFLRGFVLHIEPLGPSAYFFNFQRWDNITHSSMQCVMTWLGDSLVIYRCYVIWSRKIWVIIIPLVLLILSISTNIALLFWFVHPNSKSPSGVGHWTATIYPFAFAQNTITTGMIAFKIWWQHRASVGVGVINQSRLDLFTVMRIVVESAMIYTLQLLVLIILSSSIQEFNPQIIVQCAVIPSIGIVFVLIAVRVHFSKSKTLFGETVMASIPAWLNDSTRETEDPVSRKSIVLDPRPNNSTAAEQEKHEETFT